MRTIAITGSEGLIGSALAIALSAHGYRLRCLDLRLPRGVPGRCNVLDGDAVARLVAGCDGVIHLAAVSRVVLGERVPSLCWATNVLGTQSVIDAALTAKRRPWVLLASSREVYGQADTLPVSEDAALRPMNVYGRSKVEAEQRVLTARVQGLRTAILRFSNVYGSVADHADRVVPAFARAAALGQRLRIDGSGHLFDFTHLSDTVDGVLATIKQLELGVALPPLHLLTGQGTTLGELADMAIRASESRSERTEAPARGYDVARFVGDPTRAQALLGFRAQVSVAKGVARLVRAFAGFHEHSVPAGEL